MCLAHKKVKEADKKKTGRYTYTFSYFVCPSEKSMFFFTKSSFQNILIYIYIYFLIYQLVYTCVWSYEHHTACVEFREQL